MIVQPEEAGQRDLRGNAGRWQNHPFGLSFIEAV